MTIFMILAWKPDAESGFTQRVPRTTPYSIPPSRYYGDQETQYRGLGKENRFRQSDSGSGQSVCSGKESRTRQETRTVPCEKSGTREKSFSCNKGDSHPGEEG